MKIEMPDSEFEALKLVRDWYSYVIDLFDSGIKISMDEPMPTDLMARTQTMLHSSVIKEMDKRGNDASTESQSR